MADKKIVEVQVFRVKIFGVCFEENMINHKQNSDWILIFHIGNSKK